MKTGKSITKTAGSIRYGIDLSYICQTKLKMGNKWFVKGLFEDGFESLSIAKTEEECFNVLFELENAHGRLVKYYGENESQKIIGNLLPEE